MTAISAISSPHPDLFRLFVANKGASANPPLRHAWVAQGSPNPNPNPKPSPKQAEGRNARPSTKYQNTAFLLTAYFQRSSTARTLGRCQSIAPFHKRIKCELGHLTKPCSGSVSFSHSMLSTCTLRGAPPNLREYKSVIPDGPHSDKSHSEGPTVASEWARHPIGISEFPQLTRIGASFMRERLWRHR
jgi:hypothetical protein